MAIKKAAKTASIGNIKKAGKPLIQKGGLSRLAAKVGAKKPTIKKSKTIKIASSLKAVKKLAVKAAKAKVTEKKDAGPVKLTTHNKPLKPVEAKKNPPVIKAATTAEKKSMVRMPKPEKMKNEVGPVKPAGEQLQQKKRKKIAENLDVGSQIEAYCPRCKVETIHSVASLKRRKPWRVKCASCNVEHNYHRSQQLRERISQVEAVNHRHRKEEARGSASTSKQFDEQMLGRNPANSKQYSIREKYYINELILHPAFGVGVVVQLKEDGKIEVLFRSGSKLLVHNRF